MRMVDPLMSNWTHKTKNSRIKLHHHDFFNGGDLSPEGGGELAITSTFPYSHPQTSLALAPILDVKEIYPSDSIIVCVVFLVCVVKHRILHDCWPWRCHKLHQTSTGDMGVERRVKSDIQCRSSALKRAFQELIAGHIEVCEHGQKAARIRGGVQRKEPRLQY